MAKYLNRLNARLALAKLQESKNWMVTRKLICETDEGNVEFDAGEMVDVGGDDEGNLVLDGSAAVVVISDPEIAEKVADVLASADELSDVDFVEKSALDAVLDGEEVDDVVDALGDAEGEDIEVAEVSVDDEKKESVEDKYKKFAENTIKANKMLACESIMIAEEAAPINMTNVKLMGVKKESFDNYKEFANRVSSLKGSIKPGKVEYALNEAGEYIGSFDEEAGMGKIYEDEAFADEQSFEDFDDAPISAMDDMEFDASEDEVEIESCLGKYEESAKSGKDYIALVESLEKAGVTEEKAGKIVATFGDKRLNECVKVFDQKYGKFVAVFKESVDANNFIAEAGEDRFTKRFFG